MFKKIISTDLLYTQLEKIIQERIIFEKDHPYPPYGNGTPKNPAFPTTVGYMDINGKSLLHYAIELGDIGKVRELVSKKADVNLPQKYPKLLPIEIALQKGNTDIADYLLKNGAECNSVKAENCKNEGTRNWFSSYIKGTSFFEPRCWSSLNRATEIGDLNFIQQQLDYLQEDPSRMSCLLRVASANGQLEIVKIFSKYVSADPPEKYDESALHVAVKNRHWPVITYLVENQASVDWQNSFKRTPLMLSMDHDDLELFVYLLKHSIDPTLEDIEGYSILHYAVLKNKIDTAVIILKEQKTSSLQNNKDIYGRTPFDVAMCQNNEALCRLFNSEDSNNQTIHRFDDIVINQRIHIDRIYYYLKSHYRELTFFDEDGACAGFEFLFQLYPKTYLISTLTLISNWDGSDALLKKPFINEPQSRYHKNLDELLEQWSNDVIWFQGVKTSIPQGDRARQYSVVGNDVGYSPIVIYQQCATNSELNQLREFLQYFIKMPQGARIELTSSTHVTGAYIDDDGSIVYYDSNFRYKVPSFSELELLFKRIIDFSYIATEELRTGNKIFLNVKLFYFAKDESKLDFDNFSIFSDKELPKNKQEAESFYNSSPNSYSGVHVAVITRSHASLKRLLKDGYCDLNAKDKFGCTALDIAIENGDIKIVSQILEIKEIIIGYSRALEEAYVKGFYDIVRAVLKHPNTNNQYGLFNAAIANKDNILIQQLINNNQVDLNNILIVNAALLLAMEHDLESLIKFFIEQRAKVTKVSLSRFFFDKTPLSEVFRQHSKYYDLILDSMKDDIDQLDEQGDAAIHYAAMFATDKIDDLISRGASIFLKNSGGMTCLDYLFADKVKRAKLLEIVRKYLQTVNTAVARKNLHELLNLSVIKNDEELFTLVSTKCDKSIINSYNHEGLGLLHIATREENFSMIKLLINAGADINITTKERLNTCLHVLIKYRYPIGYIEFFLDHGAHVHLLNSENKTAIDYLYESSDNELISYFATRGFLDNFSSKSVGNGHSL
jgi:ankyrin repeat protein